MDKTQNIIININIGDQIIKRKVPFDSQDFARDIEEEINSLYNKLQLKFSNKSSRELMAMIIYQYASNFRILAQRYNEASEVASDCLKELDSIIL